MIQVRDLRVDFDSVCAVNDLTLSIPPGEIFGFIGPNGAGKTTTLRALMGLIEPTYGDILLNGVDLLTQREEAVSQVGYMPDFTPLEEDMTVYEFLDLFAASYEIPAHLRAATVDQYLQMVDLTEKRDAMMKGLSRGMVQRLILAKTLLPNPKIILLDEPASGMDPHGRALLRDILHALRDAGKTVLISSHILVELSDFCTSVGVMQRGRMMVSGAVDDIAMRVLGGTELEIEALFGIDRLSTILEADPRVDNLKRAGHVFTCLFHGEAPEASDLLATLLSAGVRVASFNRKRENLEEVFMKIGAKEVS